MLVNTKVHITSLDDSRRSALKRILGDSRANSIPSSSLFVLDTKSSTIRRRLINRSNGSGSSVMLHGNQSKASSFLEKITLPPIENEALIREKIQNASDENTNSSEKVLNKNMIKLDAVVQPFKINKPARKSIIINTPTRDTFTEEPETLKVVEKTNLENSQNTDVLLSSKNEFSRDRNIRSIRKLLKDRRQKQPSEDIKHKINSLMDKCESLIKGNDTEIKHSFISSSKYCNESNYSKKIFRRIAKEFHYSPDYNHNIIVNIKE